LAIKNRTITVLQHRSAELLCPELNQCLECSYVATRLHWSCIMDPDRIREIAEVMQASQGAERAGASTGERGIAALVAGHPEWGGYTIDDQTDVLALIDRIGPAGVTLARRLWNETH
jgi:hypothetical protein